MSSFFLVLWLKDAAPGWALEVPWPSSAQMMGLFPGEMAALGGTAFSPSLQLQHLLPVAAAALVLPAPSTPYSLMHLFMSVLRRPKYPSGQDGRQIPICRISFLSRRMKSLGEHLRHPLNSEHRSQPLAQPWLSSVLTARAREAAVGAQLCRGAPYAPLLAPQHRHHRRDGQRWGPRGPGSRCTDTLTVAAGTAPAQPGARCP